MFKNRLSAKKSCPRESDLELYLLKVNYGLPFSKKIQSHVKSCMICQDRLRQLRGFYRLFDQEISRPIPREVYLLAKALKDF
ncbi:MAG: hypothetical protein GXO76_10295 [Calditrichaeota bacterium]|nr:hypothetical protein [Calditrichota bacterium]